MSQPTSFRLSDEAIRVIEECEELTGLKRSAVIELAVRQLRDSLRKRRPKKSEEGG